MSTIFSYRQNPWPLRPMAVALLVEGGLILACSWVFHESAHRASGVVPEQTISLVMPAPMPAPTTTPSTQTPAPKSAPQPVPKQPVPHPVQHVTHAPRPTAPARPVPAPVSPPLQLAAQAMAATLEEIGAIIRAVIVGDFLAGLDAPQGYDMDTAVARERLGIGPAGMIGIAAEVPARRAVDGPFLVEDEQIARVARLVAIGFFFGEERTAIGDNRRAPLDRLDRK